MNITVLTEIDFSKPYGYVTHMVEQMKMLQAQGHMITVFAPKMQNDYPDYGLNIRYLPSIPIKGIRYLFYELYLFIHLLRVKNALAPDLIYTRSELYTLAGPCFASLFKIPHIAEINGLKIDELQLSHKSIAKRLLLFPTVRLVYWLTYRMTDTVIVVADSIKKRLENTYPRLAGRVKVVPNGVNLVHFMAGSTQDARESLGLVSKRKIIGFTGILAPWQGVEIIISALPAVLVEVPNVQFVIVGDGPSRGEYKSLAEKVGCADSVVFIGRVPYRQVPAYIRSMDICMSVKPPLVPGSPLKIREYMACGRPVIASSGTEYDFDIVERAEAGLLVDPYNKNDVAAAIVKLLSDDDLRTKMGQNGRRAMEQEYSWKRVAEKLHAICIDMVKG